MSRDSSENPAASVSRQMVFRVFCATHPLFWDRRKAGPWARASRRRFWVKTLPDAYIARFQKTIPRMARF